MLTFYSIVKGFVDNFGIIQRNAIRSWQAALPQAEIVLFGDDEVGAQQEAMGFGVPVLPMERNKHGAPLMPPIIEKAHEVAHNDIRCFINADIIIEPQFGDAVRAVAEQFESFLLIARRVGIVVEHEIDFEDDGWLEWMKGLDKKTYTRSAIDFFCYRGDWFRDIPPFGIGRTSWDNWIVNKAVQTKARVVEGTRFIKAWHQEHPKKRPSGEIAENRALLIDAQGNWGGSLDSAKWEITQDGKVAEKT